MRIAYIDIGLDGHHLSYMKELVRDNNDCILIIPNKIDSLSCKQYIIDSNMLHKHPISYKNWINSVKSIVEKEKIDIVHFLYGDVFYRYFGLGLNKFKDKKVIVTFHQIRRSTIKDVSLKRIFKNITLGIVHTKSLVNDLKKLGISNIEHIEYPQFNKGLCGDEIDAKKKLGLPDNIPVISAIGTLREDKGLDLLLKALESIKEPFHLLIAGAAISFDMNYISINTREYKEKVTAIVKYLSDDELKDCLLASDIIILPYRKSFDGASGPLGEGVWLRKMIVGPNHGSLGNIIRENHLGATFESENIESLKKIINESLKNKFIWNEKAEEYREEINPEKFKMRYNKIYETL